MASLCLYSRVTRIIYKTHNFWKCGQTSQLLNVKISTTNHILELLIWVKGKGAKWQNFAQSGHIALQPSANVIHYLQP